MKTLGGSKPWERMCRGMEAPDGSSAGRQVLRGRKPYERRVWFYRSRSEPVRLTGPGEERKPRRGWQEL